ncbi:hypothetical protein J5N97_009168 [Dioscorea zingiberensis]|uniref:Uncharacterized protein n=1 Tax=Dioscorea zingiberensis TaxID=325984 RepID=A0A9D5HLJ1_9LILI|nr:hypothetical protein J5N97_009168 [Dioscorea zingiberensis]
MKDNPRRKRSKKFCKFHQDKGHFTEDCIQLKNAIEGLIREGKLEQFLQKEPETEIEHNPPPQPIIPCDTRVTVIAGGPGYGGESSRSRKSHMRAVGSVQNVTSLKRPRSPMQICFSDEDLRGVHYPHDDALVITAQIGVFIVERVLIDTGSSVDIIFSSAFDKMKLPVENLKPMRSPLIGFNGSPLQPDGMISLPLTLETPPKFTTAVVNFLIVRCPSSYNVIIGRPSINMLKAVPLTYHMMIKFPTPNGCGEVKGDQLDSRRCYATMLKGYGEGSSRSGEALTVEDIQQEDDEREKAPAPVEELKAIPHEG